MGFELLLAFPAAKKVIDVLRYIADGEVVQWKEIGIVVASWVVGFGTAALVATSSFAENVGLVGASWQDLALAGVMIGSAAGASVDFFKASADIK